MDYHLPTSILSAVSIRKRYVYGDPVVFVRFSSDYYVTIYISRAVFQGVLPVMASTGRLRLKGVSFACCRKGRDYTI